MLDGLEITELRFSESRLDNPSLRIDSEYFKKEYLSNLERIRTYSAGHLHFWSEIESLTGGATPLGADYPETGVPFLRVQNIMRNYIEDSDLVFITKKDDYELRRSRLRLDDVLLTITGVSYGKSAVVIERNVGSNINQHSVRIALSKKHFSPFFISTFLNSKFGKLQSDRNVTGVTRPALDYEAIRCFLITLHTEDFQAQIDGLVRRANRKLSEAKALYEDAQILLLDNLGLRDWQPPTENTSVKSFRESFAATGRLDAEYYQPKYDYAYEKLEELRPNTIVPLGSLLDVLTNGQTPLHHDLSNGEIVFLTAEHVSDFRIDFDSEKRVEREHHEKQLAKTAIRQNDLLITIKGKIGNVAVVENVPTPTNINQDVGLLRLKAGVNPYFVAGYINSLIGRSFVNQISTGQINPFLGLGNLQTIPVPIFDQADVIGEKIKSKVIEAEKAAHESKHLLETAKRAVEIAIEQSEEAAMEYIAANTK